MATGLQANHGASGGLDVAFHDRNQAFRWARLAKNLLRLLHGTVEVYVCACHNNGRNLPKGGARGNLPEELVALYHRQIHIEDDEVRRFQFKVLQRSHPVGNVHGVEPGHSQDTAVQLAQCHVVFDEKDFVSALAHHHEAIRLQLLFRP